MKLDPKSLNQALKEPYALKLDDTQHIITGHMTMCDFKKPFVATSWGKDSTVLSHLIVEQCKKNDIKPTDKLYPDFVLINTLNIYKEEPIYWKKIQKFLEIPDEKFKIFKPVNNQTVWSIADKVGYLPNFRKPSKSGTNYIPYEFRKEPECCNILKKESFNDHLKSLAEEERFDLQFIGIRAIENQTRRFNILMHCRTYFTDYGRPYKMRNCLPIGFWSDQDIDKYLEENDIPENPAYKVHNQKRLGCASCPAHIGWEVRLASDPTKDGKGQLYQNLRIIRATQPQRFLNSIVRLRFLHLAEDIIQKILNEPLVSKWEIAKWDEPLIVKANLMKENTSLDSFMHKNNG